MASVASISQQIWDMKYRLKAPDGAAVDKTIEDTWRRVAAALAEPEAEKPIGPTVSTASWRISNSCRPAASWPAPGSGRNVTLFNCFVMGTIPDDMSGIFAHLREAALTMQQGGGIGYDFSTLRPKGAPVKGVGADASGPSQFMDVWDAMCRTIMSAGYRRGAMMATLRCDHPDIEAFIDAKRDPGRLRMFNLSVLVTDAFMTAVHEGAPWELSFDGTTFKMLPARELWDKIMRATYAYAEPGVIFIDRINKRNNLALLRNHQRHQSVRHRRYLDADRARARARSRNCSASNSSRWSTAGRSPGAARFLFHRPQAGPETGDARRLCAAPHGGSSGAGRDGNGPHRHDDVVAQGGRAQAGRPCPAEQSSHGRVLGRPSRRG